MLNRTLGEKRPLSPVFFWLGVGYTPNNGPWGLFVTIEVAFEGI
jgi:hypothetical protein